MEARSLLRGFCVIVAALGLAMASYWNVRTAIADHLQRQASLDAATRATEMDPLDSRGFLAKAQYEEQAGLDASATWRAAADLDPRNARILIPAGISAELHGNANEAERYFLDAEKYNLLWLPRWTLANYYFRKGDTKKTLHWINRALERSYGDLSAAFTLAEQAGATPQQIFNEVLPAKPYPFHAFAFWLSQQNVDRNRAILAARSLRKSYDLLDANSNHAQAEYFTLVVSGRLMNAGLGDIARTVWRSGCEARILDCTMPPDDGLIMNGAFSKKFIALPLDWSLPKVPGITSIQQPGTGTVKYSFSGEHPENCELLRQSIVLEPKVRWRVQFDFQTREISPLASSSLEWRIGSALLSLKKPFASESWEQNEFIIETGEKGGVQPLVLAYSRKPGTVRITGELWLRNVRAERIQ